ncbi:MAG: aminotransferase class III-fold pyridoxal phosphate-dependent enzyme, partial [Candidatus Promineifilaceae bacterium]|nr:aminotransferase class III-fold pyridoxal phosphate-dependent enzyme [Candidatus Promineifilaceae bacterium]
MNSNENVLEISRAQNGRATGAKEASAYAEPQAGAPAQPSRAEPASRSSDYYIALADKYVAHIYEPLNVVIERGEGVWVWDVEGNRYLDCLSAYSALNQGHVHPRIMAAAVAQMGRVTLTSRA